MVSFELGKERNKERCFFQKKILSLHEELNLRPSEYVI